MSELHLLISIVAALINILAAILLIKASSKILEAYAQEDLPEVMFSVRKDEASGFTARAVDYSIFTEAESLDDLEKNMQEAAELHLGEPCHVCWSMDEEKISE